MPDYPIVNNYTQSTGTSNTNPYVTHFAVRDPTTEDINYPIQKRWINTLFDREWILESFTTVPGFLQAVWSQVSSGTLGLESLTGTTGGPVNPDVNHNINLLGGSAAVTVVGTPLNNTLTIDVDPDLLAYYSLTPFIVGQVGDVHAQFTGATAIQDAIDAAVAPANVIIKSGTYIVNLNLKPGVDIVSLSQDTIIKGRCRLTIAGSVTFYGITLETNGDYCLECTGSGVCFLSLVSCFIDMPDHVGVNNANTNAATQISIEETDSDSHGSFPLWTQTGPGLIFLRMCYSGGASTTTAATTSAGTVNIWWSFINFPLITSGTTNLNLYFAILIPGSDLGLTLAGSGAHTIEESEIAGQVIINSPCNASISQTTVNTTQTNSITGTGRLDHSNITFLGTTSTMNVTTQNLLPVNTSGATSGFVWTSTGPNTSPTWQVNGSGYSPANIVVSPIAGQGQFTTISAAVAAASSGDNIFIREGTYTENVAVTVANLSFSALPGSANVGTVNVLGQWSFSLAGSLSISNMNLQTNGSFILNISGANASLVYLNNCFLNCTNSTGISYSCSNAASFIEINDGGGDLTTTGISFWNHSAAGFIETTFFAGFNTGNSITPSNNSAGAANLQNSLFESPFSTSATGGIGVQNTIINTLSTNTTALTANGTGTTATEGSQFVGGTSPAIVIGAGAVFQVALNSSINSSNVNAIAGSGTLNARYLTFSGVSSTIQGTITVNTLPGLP